MAGENSHYGIAKTELGADWRGDADDAYAEMWNRGWVRVVDYGDKLYAERYEKGRAVKLAELTPAQRAWLDDQALAGKQFFWNDKLFSQTTESRSERVCKFNGVLFSRKGRYGTARQASIPAEVCERGATPPDRPFRENPPGGGAFVRGLRWRAPWSPQGDARDSPPGPQSKSPAAEPLSIFRHALRPDFGNSSSVE